MKVNLSQSQLRKVYTSTLLMLTKNFCNDLISVDEYKSALTELCNSYRKEFKIKYYGNT